MHHYYVNDNAQDDGYHEVHKEGCSWMPDASNRSYLGYFSNCEDAVKKAKEKYRKSDGCAHCSKECHKR